MNVFAVQYDIAWEDRAANIATIRRMLDAAQPPPRSMIVLPEMGLTGFSMRVDKVADSAEQESASAYVALARDYRAWVIGGLVTRAADGRGLNEAIVVNPEGAIAGRYVKLHPFTFTGEDEHYASGDDLLLVECDGLRVAPLVCYDLRFPEVFRTAVRRGTEMFVVIACWLEGRHAHWPALLQARAIENQAWVLGVNRVGRDPKHRYLGGSRLIDPAGNIVAEAGSEASILQGIASRDILRHTRESFPALRDMRPDWVRP